MYRHIKVSSTTQMNNEIFNFLGDILNITPSGSTIRIKSKNEKNIIWFVKRSSGMSVWITDTSEGISESPSNLSSTVGVAAKYKLDMHRKEIDAGETASAKADLKKQNEKAYKVMKDNAKLATEYLSAYEMWYNNNKKIEEDIEVYEDVWHRVSTTNPCHIGGLLKYIFNSGDEIWLDCLYSDNTFMFSIYSLSIPSITRSLIVGDMNTYQESVSGKTFFISNSWLLSSNYKYGSYGDSFFLRDIVGEGRIPSQERAIALAEFLDNDVDDYWDKRAEEKEAEKEMDSCKKAYDEKKPEVEEARILANLARSTADIAMANAEAETDPTTKESKMKIAEELEERAVDAETGLSELEDVLAELEQAYLDAKAEYESAVQAREASYNIFFNKYSTFSDTILAVGKKEDNLHHHTADCPAISKENTYNNDLFCAYRIDVDNDANSEPQFSANGVKTAFRLHTAPRDLHLKYYDISDIDLEDMTVPTLYGWEHKLLHYVYENEESDVGANIYPWLDTIKKPYEVYDSLSEEFKSFYCFSRSGTGGNNVNNVNNISTTFPLTFYVERDGGDDLKSWSATGQSDAVYYVNMYNIGTGTTIRLNKEFSCACYDLYRRRLGPTFWNPLYNDKDNTYTEAWGFGGYPGIMFKYSLKDDFTDLRARVVI